MNENFVTPLDKYLSFKVFIPETLHVNVHMAVGWEMTFNFIQSWDQQLYIKLES